MSVKSDINVPTYGIYYIVYAYIVYANPMMTGIYISNSICIMHYIYIVYIAYILCSICSII